MATGDRLYIADKETLDNTYDAVSRLENMMSSSPAYSDSMTATDILQKYKVGRVLVNTAVPTTYLNISGSGEIYGILYTTAVLVSSATAGITNNFKVVVDDIEIYSSTYMETAAVSYGIITPACRVMTYGVSTTGLAVVAPGGYLQVGSTTNVSLPDNDYNNICLYLPKVIRFERSLQVVASLSDTANVNTAGRISYMYKLD